MPMSRTLARLFGALALASATVAAVTGPAAADDPMKLKMVLNWKYQGPQAWFFVAQDKGYFAAEGLELQIDQGEGSGAAVPKVASGAYDIGFGDINALINFAATKPDGAPVAVYMLYNNPPFTVATMKASGIAAPKDLAGRTLGAPPNDAALKLFPAFAGTTGIDPATVTVTNVAANLREQLLLRGQVDAIAGYVNTIWFSAKAIGIDPARDMTFINYADHGMNLYSNAIIVSHDLAANHPDAVKGLLRAVNKAFFEVVADPEMGMDAVMRREPLLKRDIETERLKATLDFEIVSPEVKRLGIGDVDDARLAASIRTVVDAYGLPRAPAPAAVFDRRFLPPAAERAWK